MSFSFPIMKRFFAENFLSPVKKGLKIHVFGGLGGENFWPWSWDPPPLGNQSSPEHVIWRKKGGDTPKNVFPRAAQEITNKKKINIWTWYFTPLPGGPCWADCSEFLRVGCHPRRNHAYQILSRSHWGLRSYGGLKSGFSYVFLNRCYNSVTHYRATLWQGNMAALIRRGGLSV